MNRRRLLAILTTASATVAGCAQSPTREPETTTDTEKTTAKMTTSEPVPDRTTSVEDQPTNVKPDALVELYDFAADLHGSGVQQFDDALAAWDGESYLQATKQFSRTQQQFADSNAALTRITRAITEAGVGGFQIADAAETRTGFLERAAGAYAEAAIARIEGNDSTADSLAEDAATFRTRADNHSFGTPQAFESALRSSL